jgi:type IV pilus assembly protein PilB
LRVSTVPTVYGEKVVMRIQDAQSYLKLKLEDLGFEEDDLKKFREAIYNPWGMILVTGPTGSGKTTTLYTALMERNKEDVNISTAEDPVEVAIPGVNQVHVKEKIGLTFAEALRAFLRQDPDIILVGEIRDHETAEIAVKAALTGHLVFSTLHTNDAPSSITRLIDIGVDNFLVGTAVSLIVAQRLVRKLCPECKQPAEYPPEFWKGLGFSDEEIKNGQFFVHKKDGCNFCNHTGYKGRIAVHEILKMDEDIRKLVLERKSADDIREVAIKNGMRTLYQNGLLKVKRGITDIAEVERVLMK